MKIMKKVILLALSLTMMLTFMPASAFAEGETAKPVSAFIMGDLGGVPGETDITGLDVDSTSLDVTFSDGSIKSYVYGPQTYKDENGQEYTDRGFYLEGADPAEETSRAEVSVAYEKLEPLVANKDNKVTFRANISYLDGDKVVSTILEFTQYVFVRVDEPVKVEFVPSKDFKLEGTIGYNYIEESDFYGEGNKFLVTVKYVVRGTDPVDYGEYTAEYIYTKAKNQFGDTVEGFYDNGNPDFERADLSDGFNCYLSKGTNNAELTYYAYLPGRDDPIELPFNVTINASKYDAYTNWPIYEYTGKVIKPKFTVWNSADKKIPAKEYTVGKAKSKKIGWHNVEIKFKSAYKNKYATETITASYGIGPKAPKLTKLTGGKKKLTATWKKFTKAQLKQITGGYIEIAKDKDMISGYKLYKLSKKDIKSGKKVLKKLKKGKYYLRMQTYKSIKQNGVKFEMPSKESVLKNAKVK